MNDPLLTGKKDRLKVVTPFERKENFCSLRPFAFYSACQINYYNEILLHTGALIFLWTDGCSDITTIICPQKNERPCMQQNFIVMVYLASTVGTALLILVTLASRLCNREPFQMSNRNKKY